MSSFTIRVGDYLIDGGLLLIILIVFIVVTILFISSMSRAKKKTVKNTYRITKWQKQEIPQTIEFVEEEIPGMEKYIEENSNIVEGFGTYLKKNNVWDYDHLVAIAENTPFVMTNILFQDAEFSLTECADGGERALLLLYAIDMINGGPVMEGRKMIWIPSYIEEFPDQGITPDEARLKSVLQSAIMRLADEMDKETGMIDPAYDLPYYVKSYVLEDAQYALGDLAEKSGVFHIEERSRKLIIHSLLMCLKTSLIVDTGCLSPMDVLYLRALICMLDKQLYDAVSYSVLKSE